MTEATTLTAEERRRIIGDYLKAVFGDRSGGLADPMRVGAPDLAEDPTVDQVAAWVEVVDLLRDPGCIVGARGMGQRALALGPAPHPAPVEIANAIGAPVAAAMRAGAAPDSPEALSWPARPRIAA